MASLQELALVKKPAFEVFLALASLARHFRRHWIVVTQAKLLERMREATGRAMSRRTLNRHLAALERGQVIARQRRHSRHHSGKLRMRATLYTFPTVGMLWISRLNGFAKIPSGRLAVSKMAQSQNRSIYRRRTNGDRGPRKRGQERSPGKPSDGGRWPASPSTSRSDRRKGARQ